MSTNTNNVETVPNMPPELVKLGVNPLDATWVRVREGDCMFRPLLQFLSRSAQHSFEVDQVVKGKKKPGSSHPLTVSGLVGAAEATKSTQLRAGLGTHEVVWEGETLFVCFERIGATVGTHNEAKFLEEFVVYCRGSRKQGVLWSFVEHCYNLANQNDDEDTYRIYTWEIEERWWKTSAVRQKRPIESVVLPEETKSLILADLDTFLAEETAEWYGKHGICYKRSYLLYGPPGTGKTSFLSAIASKYDRNLCFLQAGHPMLTDSSLHQALNQAPENSVLVMEDVDSLFADRKSDSRSPLTFSGILNALDGLASPQGNIFFLTSNHPERLDPAMLRHGRVDVRAEFPAATEAQVAGLWRTFYPNAPVESAVTFSQGLKKHWGSMNLAALQDFFIQNRTRTAAEALANVDSWLKQQTDAEQAVKDFEARNLARAAAKAAAGGAEENQPVADEVVIVPAAPAAAAKGKGKKKAQRQSSDHPVTLSTVWFGVAVVALYLLLSKKDKQ